MEYRAHPVTAAAAALLFLALSPAAVRGADYLSFVEDNLKSITIASLDNGIPVFVKQSDANRVCALKVVLNGHVVFTPEEKAGLEAIVLSAMARGSRSYSYDDLQALQYRTSSAIRGSVMSYDLTSFDLLTLDKYFATLYEAFADCYLHPAFDAKQFSQVMNDYNIVFKKNMSDPYSRATTLLHAAEFASHPYEADFQGTESSLASITLDDAKRYYASAFAPERMAIIAVGDFDPVSLIAKLNASFGKMPKTGLQVPTPPALPGRGDLLIADDPSSEGVAYIRGDFPLPPLVSPDYTTAAFAFTMLSDLLFDVVRTEHGACYSVWVQGYAMKSPYGSFGVYKTTVPEAVKGYLDEAVGILASGRCLAAGAQGTGKYVPIADALAAYKAKYINAFYSTQSTNATIAGQIASSYFLRDDYSYYLKVAERIDAITVEDITRVIGAYVKDVPAFWIALGDKALLEKVQRSDYLK
jgi:zinc protease